MVLRKFFLVLEKVENLSPDYKIYLLTDPEATGNSIFCYRSILPKQSLVCEQDLYNRKGSVLVSKESGHGDERLFINQNALNQGHSADIKGLPDLHNSRRDEGSLESIDKVSCNSSTSKTGNKPFRPVTSKNCSMFCNSKENRTCGKLSYSAEGYGRVPFPEERTLPEKKISTQSYASARPKDVVCRKDRIENRTNAFVRKDFVKGFGFAKSMGGVDSLRSGECCNENGKKSDVEEGPVVVEFLLIFMQKVALLETIREHGKLEHYTNINGVIMGRFGFPVISGNREGGPGEVNCTGGTVTNSVGDLRSRLIANSPYFESVNQKELNMKLLLEENFLSDYTFIKSGNIYIFESRLRISDIESNAKQVSAKLRFDARLYLAELKQTELLVCGCGVILLPEDCISRIAKTILSFYDSRKLNASVRPTLQLAVANRLQ